MTRFRQNLTQHKLRFQKLEDFFFIFNLPIHVNMWLAHAKLYYTKDIWTPGRNDRSDFSYRSPKSNLRSNQIMGHVKCKLWLCWFSKHQISYSSNSSIQHRTDTKAAVRIDFQLFKFKKRLTFTHIVLKSVINSNMYLMNWEPSTA